jgi:hypothetical protein
VSSSDEYRRKAQRYLEMAKAADDPIFATSLRLLAADFLHLAEQMAKEETDQPIQPREAG